MSIDALPGAADFQRWFKGEVVTAASPDYDLARKVWNGDIDRRPLAIVKATDDADVAAAIRFAREADAPLGVRAGGHSYPGHSMVAGGIVIDLAKMGNVDPDLAAQQVKIGGGALLGNVDRALIPAGEVMPAGVVSHTGMPGLALGGGVGFLSRSLGLTCDQFVRLRLVTADGEVIHVSTQEHPELFWALRGGGGNFGVVTEFECRTHRLGPVQAGALVFKISDAPDAITALDSVLQMAPRELTISCSHGLEADRFGLAEALKGERVLLVHVVYRGNLDDPILTELRNAAQPLLDTVATTDFLAVQTMSDDLAPAGIGWYMKSGHTRALSRPLLEWMAEKSVDYRDNISSPAVAREVFVLQALGGAVQDVDEADTAYSGRAANWHAAIEAGFTNPEERERIVPWIRDSWQSMRPLLDMTTSYVNLNFEEGTDPLTDVFGPEKYARLQTVKTEFDPTNLFRHNFNIKPLGDASSA